MPALQPAIPAGVILAAGSSSRFGSAKQLAMIGGETMLGRVAGLARAAGLSPLVAVLPPGLQAPTGTRAVVNDRPSEGLSRSLRMGFAALPAGTHAAIVLLGDQPGVEPATIRALIDRAADGRPVVAPFADGRIGPPVLIRGEAFHLVEETRGDDGLANVLARYPDLVTFVEIATHSPDIDTPADLARFLGDPAGRGAPA